MTRLRDLALRIGADQPMYGLGTPPAQSLAEIESASERATFYVALIREAQPQGPYFLAGFCLGGTLAFEAAQQLRSQGQEVAFLALLNSWVPISTIPVAQWAQLIFYRVKYHLHRASAAGWRRGVPYLLSKFGTVPKLYRRAREMRKTPCALESAGDSPPSSSPKKVLWGTIRIWGKYVPQQFAGKVHLFLSDEADLAGVSQRVDPRRGWARVCSSCEVIQLQGEHVQMLDSPLLDSFAERFAGCLAEAQKTVRIRPPAHSMTA
jgi:phthiocerol/phenolphthiocerol synthesis type-I polyketide synthase D